MWKVITLALVSLGSPLTARSQSCADTTSGSAVRLHLRARSLASDTSEAYRIYRDSVMKTSTVTEASVVIVTIDSICQLATTAYTAEITVNPPHTVSVLVYQVGSDFLVVDPQQSSGGPNRVGFVFSSSFVRKSNGVVRM